MWYWQVHDTSVHQRINDKKMIPKLIPTRFLVRAAPKKLVEIHNSWVPLNEERAFFIKPKPQPGDLKEFIWQPEFCEF